MTAYSDSPMIADPTPQAPAMAPLPRRRAGRPPGRWALDVIELLAAEAAGRSIVKRYPLLRQVDRQSIRAAAYYRDRGIHIVNTPCETHVWLKKRK